MPDQLVHHFAEVMDGQDQALEQERALRAFIHEMDRRGEERHFRERSALIGDVVNGVRSMAQMFKRAGFVLPVIENIRPESGTTEPGLSLICNGVQFRVRTVAPFRSVPGMLKIEKWDEFSKKRSDTHPYQQIWSVDLDRTDHGALAKQVLDGLFATAIKNFTPAARQKLQSSLGAPAP